MGQHRNERAGDTGDLGENPPTSGFVRHDMRKLKSDTARNRSRFVMNVLSVISIFSEPLLKFCFEVIPPRHANKAQMSLKICTKGTEHCIWYAGVLVHGAASRELLIPTHVPDKGMLDRDVSLLLHSPTTCVRDYIPVTRAGNLPASCNSTLFRTIYSFVIWLSYHFVFLVSEFNRTKSAGRLLRRSCNEFNVNYNTTGSLTPRSRFYFLAYVLNIVLCTPHSLRSSRGRTARLHSLERRRHTGGHNVEWRGHNVEWRGHNVMEGLEHSLHAKANWTPLPVGSTPNFRMWESCQAMLLIGAFSRGSSISPAFYLRRCSILNSFHPHRLSRTVESRQNLSTQHLPIKYVVKLQKQTKNPEARVHKESSMQPSESVKCQNPQMTSGPSKNIPHMMGPNKESPQMRQQSKQRQSTEEVEVLAKTVHRNVVSKRDWIIVAFAVTHVESPGRGRVGGMRKQDGRSDEKEEEERKWREQRRKVEEQKKREKKEEKQQEKEERVYVKKRGGGGTRRSGAPFSRPPGNEGLSAQKGHFDLAVCGPDGVWSGGRIRGNLGPWSVPAGVAKRGAAERIPVGDMYRLTLDSRTVSYHRLTGERVTVEERRGPRPHEHDPPHRYALVETKEVCRDGRVKEMEKCRGGTTSAGLQERDGEMSWRYNFSRASGKRLRNVVDVQFQQGFRKEMEKCHGCTTSAGLQEKCKTCIKEPSAFVWSDVRKPRETEIIMSGLGIQPDTFNGGRVFFNTALPRWEPAVMLCVNSNNDNSIQIWKYAQLCMMPVDPPNVTEQYLYCQTYDENSAALTFNMGGSSRHRTLPEQHGAPVCHATRFTHTHWQETHTHTRELPGREVSFVTAVTICREATMNLPYTACSYCNYITFTITSHFSEALLKFYFHDITPPSAN
ncbi:hypothetical protein PR048_033001 [Dryococelus australis]|uniref:Uncharacterized protein n=1 Tax=Dryococelus australis TaxID=614101 RepID=A0ABQ9G500_9NEOP|nr:hypothetical protein PR048_033001 [Dryococelus australis]